MQFVDEATIEVAAGRGGDGCLSFLRARNLPRGGPDGGNGGSGGDVVLVGDEALNTLVDFRFTRRFQAPNGSPGAGRQRTGANGGALRIRVPVGTTVIDGETRTTMGDIAAAGEELAVARGGGRGFGNTHFKSSTNRAPRRTTPGRPGERRRLLLELKLIADVGLLGMPNAGKSTLISRVTASRPRIADYPFTTLVPNLGVVRVGDDASFVMADVPGLIRGAAAGAGLGHEFLRHLSRVRLLLHLVDLAPVDGSDPVANARALEEELAVCSAAFAEREIWVVPTKLDLPDAARALDALREATRGQPFHPVSAVTGEGVDALMGAVMTHVNATRERLAADPGLVARDRAIQERIAADLRAGPPAAPPEDAPDDDVEVEYRHG